MYNAKLPLRRCRGGILLVSMVIAAAFSLVLASLLSLLNTERRINERSILKIKADYAAYALLELGVAQVKAQVQQIGVPYQGWQPTLSINTTTFTNFINQDPDASLSTTAGDVALVAGLTPAATQKFYDPAIPQNKSDPMLGQEVSSNELPIYAKVTLVTPSGLSVTSYATASLEVRGSPLFLYAAFFNMDLDAFAGGDMIINGRVHTNGNFSLSSNSASAVQALYANVTAAGKFDDDQFFGNNNRGTVLVRRPDGTWVTTGTSSKIWTTPGGDVIYADALSLGNDFAGDPISFASLQQGSNSNDHLYSEDIDWYSQALNNFDGAIRTGEHGIGNRSVPGMQDYVFKTKSTTAGFNNTSYQIIQPVRPANDATLTPPDPSDPDYDSLLATYNSNWTREKEKFAYKSGLTLKVNGTAITQTETYNNGAKTKTFTTLDPATVTVTAETYDRDANGNIQYDASGNPLVITLQLPSDLIEVEPYQEITSTTGGEKIVTSGLRDNRRERALNLIKVDVRRLKDVVDNYGSAGGTEFDVDPATFWNGGVFVEFPSASATPRALDGVQAGIDGYGLYLHNGGITSTGDADVDRALPKDGLTISTNNVVYIAGNYNADGVLQSNSSATPDNTAGREVEVPAAVAADAVVLLSNSWESKGDPLTDSTATAGNELYSNEGRTPSSNRPAVAEVLPSATGLKARRASDTEYSTAIIAGQVPRGKITETGTQSNSTLANYLRFLEDWNNGNITATVRGSTVALFETEIATQHLPGHSDIYIYPRRNYGFNTLFDTKQPPLAPRLLDFRRVRYAQLSVNEYNSLIP